MTLNNHKDISTLQQTLSLWCGTAVPQQFAQISLFETISYLCSNLKLPSPQMMGGNIVIGEITNADYILSAHLDEASFSVVANDGGKVILRACHRAGSKEEHTLSFVGIRNQKICLLGDERVTKHEAYFVARTELDIRLGDRAVYTRRAFFHGDLFCAKSIDDRVGAIIALRAMAQLQSNGPRIAVVLSDGEQNLPDGYFSRTFPHILRHLNSKCRIIFVDGIFQEQEAEFPADQSPQHALLVPHSGEGRGYSVPPLLFARLRDAVIPGAQKQGIKVAAAALYHSRGDDWGMVTNPTSGIDHEAFFISFGGWGPGPEERTININSIFNCEAFIPYAVRELAT